MENKKFEIIFFELENKNYFQKWFNSLKDRKLKIIVNKRILKIQEEGHFGDTKYLENEIFELRIFYGAGYRIYYAKEGSKIIIILCAGDKNSQRKDIEKAKKLIERWKKNEN